MAGHADDKIETVVGSSSESNKSGAGLWGEHMETEPVNITGAYQEFEE